MDFSILMVNNLSFTASSIKQRWSATSEDHFKDPKDMETLFRVCSEEVVREKELFLCPATYI